MVGSVVAGIYLEESGLVDSLFYSKFPLEAGYCQLSVALNPKEQEEVSPRK